MDETVKAEDFAAAIAETLEEYAGLVGADVDVAVDKTAKDAMKKVAKGGDFKGTGAYRKSIAQKKLKGSSLIRRRVVYARAPYYRLTHLLEYGHATANGGRTRAFPHWEPAEEQAATEFVNTLKEELNR